MKHIRLIVACAAGAADEKLLQQITENVVKLSTADAESIKAFPGHCRRLNSTTGKPLIP